MTLVKTSYNRRSFLKASAATSGGMVLGFSWLASCTPPTAEQLLTMPSEWFDINAFLKIGDNGVVTIFSPNPEIGQNVKTSMPMIVAEELDVDWEKVVVEQAGLNTSKYTRQLAGGSQSIRQGWQSLRMAGATARRMLLEAAAQEWAVPVGELSTSAGEIMHEGSGKK
ncbi:MAG: molybdopterin-dependent oxidoreductase, partial [Saprospiraceae bacterium]|nr:molybdopterin-dependent oxidoreductase [Saprospiraceae bacterium]